MTKLELMVALFLGLSQPVVLGAQARLETVFEPGVGGKENINILLKVDNPKLIATLDPNDPYALKAENYTIIEKKSGHEIPLAKDPIPTGYPGIRGIRLIPQEEISSDSSKSYSVRVKHDIALKLSDGTQQVVAAKEYALNSQEVITDRKILAPQSTESKIEVLTGTGGGAISAKYHLREDSQMSAVRNGVASGDAWFHIDLTAAADVNVTPKEKGKYFDSMVADLDLFHAYSWPTLDPKNPPAYLPPIMGHSEFGLTSRVETDRDVKIVDATVGATYEMFLKNIVTTTLHSVFVPDIQEAGVAPLFVFAYDYVNHVKETDQTKSGNNRLRAEFTWSLPLRRQWVLPILGSTDADLLFDIGGIYDFDKKRVTDTTKLTLEVKQHDEKDKGWSYTLAYAQGKATPTFKNFDAVLAGLKKSF